MQIKQNEQGARTHEWVLRSAVDRKNTDDDRVLFTAANDNRLGAQWCEIRACAQLIGQPLQASHGARVGSK
jgi:hypothetical protein